MHDDVLENEVFGVLAGLGGADDELGVVADDFADPDLDLAVVLLRLFGGLLTVFLRRDVDDESADVHAVDMHGLDEEAHDAGAEVEVLDGDERVRCSRGDDVIRRIDAQAAAGDLQAMEHRDVERIELDLALEAGAERLDDAAFEDGGGVTQNDLGDRWRAR